ncbi:MAG TPA: hypothetical protein VMH06_05630 [Thermodesulfovibrionales bacterium]|nr:hypothetical protein [Thermodesulfovibrionales bacterium]
MDYFDDSGSERAALYRLFASLFMQEPSEETLFTIRQNTAPPTRRKSSSETISSSGCLPFATK